MAFVKHDVPLDESDRPAVDSSVAWIDVDGEIVAVQREAETIHLISETGALLWPFLDGTTTIGDLADDVSDVFGIGRQQALADLSTLLAEMREQMLLAGQRTDSSAPG